MTLALAILGLVLSLLSLLWQGYTWRRNGAVLRVKVTNSFPVYGDQLGDHYVTVTVVNEGRAATTVTGWGIDMGGHGNLTHLTPVSWSTQLPHRLEAGAEASFHMPADGIRHHRAATGMAYSSMVPWVRSAGDRRHVAKAGLDKVLSD